MLLQEVVKDNTDDGQHLLEMLKTMTSQYRCTFDVIEPLLILRAEAECHVDETMTQHTMAALNSSVKAILSNEDIMP